MKKLMVFGWLMIASNAFCQQATGEIVGTVVEKNGTTIVGALVFVIDQDRKYQAITDLDGRFRMSAVPAGKYQMNIKFVQDTMRDIAVEVPMDGFYQAGEIAFIPTTKELIGVTVKADDGRMKLVYGTLPIKELTADEIEKSPRKFDIKGLVTSINPDVKMSEDGELMFRGSRKGDMIYMLDGVKGRSVSNVPSCSISRMMVYTGGLPAKYGDTLGGAVIVETKSYFELYREWEREEMKKNK